MTYRESYLNTRLVLIVLAAIDLNGLELVACSIRPEPLEECLPAKDVEFKILA